MALKRTYTRGILSNVKRADLGTQTRVFQTDAAINPGNSGGPLFDREGRVLGINTYAGRGMHSIGFTVLIDVAETLRRHFLRHGRFVRALVPWFFTAELYDELARALQADRGVLIAHVLPDSPAHWAGLRDGDILIAVDGRPCSARRRVELVDFEWSQAIREPGEEVVYTVMRGPPGRRQQMDVRARLEAIEPLPRMGRHLGELVELRYEALELGVLPIVTLHRINHSLPDDRGVLVTTVRPASPASRAGLRPLDILTAVEGTAVPDVDAFVRRFEAALASHVQAIELQTVRGRRRLPTALAPHYTLQVPTALLAVHTNVAEMAALVRRELLAEGIEVATWSLTEDPPAPADGAYDLVVVLSPDAAPLRRQPQWAGLVRAAWTNEGGVAAAGAATLAVLPTAPELRGKRMTANRASSVEAARRGAVFTGKEVEADGRWITCASFERSAIRAFVRAIRRAAWNAESATPEADNGVSLADGQEES